MPEKEKQYSLLSAYALTLDQETIEAAWVSGCWYWGFFLQSYMVSNQSETSFDPCLYLPAATSAGFLILCLNYGKIRLIIIPMTIHDFIKKRKYLIWWVKDYDHLSAASIVEATLNYGDWDDVQKLIKILGMKRVARIFREKSKLSPMGRCNYAEKTKHFFATYFNKYAPRDTYRRAN